MNDGGARESTPQPGAQRMGRVAAQLEEPAENDDLETIDALT